jgi:beta-glucosidase
LPHRNGTDTDASTDASLRYPNLGYHPKNNKLQTLFLLNLYQERVYKNIALCRIFYIYYCFLCNKTAPSIFMKNMKTLLRTILLFTPSAIILCLLFFLAPCLAQNKQPLNTEELIAKMTLEEKVGQMMNLTLSTITKEKDEPLTIDTAKLRDVIVTHHVGNIQNVVTHAYTLKEWHALITLIQDVSLKQTRLKIPDMYCIDAVHGTNFTLGSTLFPHNIGLAATRNPELAGKCSEITAKEVRASGIRYDFSPVLDIGRQPLWPRFGETFGEDVFLLRVMSTASIKGYEGTDLKSTNSVAACMKHYLGYSVPNNGKDRAPASIPEIEVREYFMPSFKAAIEAGTHTLMVNSGAVNGVPLHASKYWLTEVLRNELGYKGLIISDWEDIKKLTERHHVADTHKEAARLAVEAGIDMCIVPFDFTFYEDVIALVKEGSISEKRIDESVRRILDLKRALGLFDNAYPETAAVKNFGLPAYKNVALDAARESITLLKNDNVILPLVKNKKIFITGPGAASLTSLHGAWSYTWQGTDPKFFSKETLSILKAINQKNGTTSAYLKGTGFTDSLNLQDVLSSAKAADYVVVCLGEDAYAETPGNITDLELPSVQKELVRELSKAGKPLILVLTEGRPRIIREIEPLVSAVIMAYWPGSQGAQAIADVLFGDYNPDGKLPFTYPRYSGELLPYDHKYLDEAIEIVQPYKYSFVFNPQFHFGQGLSYTTFDYSNLQINTNTLTPDGSAKVSVTVKNTGKRAGKETVELYISDLYASVAPSVKKLKGFKKIYLEPGASATVEFELSKNDLSFISSDLKRITEPGEFDVMIGSLKQNLVYRDK